MVRADPLGIFRNKRMTFGDTPLLPFQPVRRKRKIQFHLKKFHFGCSPYRLGSIYSRLKLNSFRAPFIFLLAKQQQVAALHGNKVKIISATQHMHSLYFLDQTRQTVRNIGMKRQCDIHFFGNVFNLPVRLQISTGTGSSFGRKKLFHFAQKVSRISNRKFMLLESAPDIPFSRCSFG